MDTEDLEISIIGCIMTRHRLTGSYKDTPFTMLTEENFNGVHKEIYIAAKQLYDDDKPTDRLAIMHEMGNDSDLLSYEEFAEIDPTHHCRILLEKSEWHRVETAIKSAQYVLETEGVAEAQDILESALAIREIQEQTFIGMLQDAVRRFDDNMTTGGVTGLSTGFTDLDSLTGGIGEADMVVLAARPSMGKTSLALQIARQVGRNHSVGIVSVESSDQEIVDRMAFQQAELSYQSYRSGHMGKDKIKSFMDSCSVLGTLNIKINHTSQNIREIHAWAKQTKPDLLIIDYLQLIGGGRGDSDYARTSDLSHRVKVMTKICPVIVLSQLSRAVEGRGKHEPILSDMRDSGKIEEDADQVWMMFRPEMYKVKNFDNGAPTENVTQIFVRKHRNGPTGEIKLIFNKPSMSFGNYTELTPYEMTGAGL